MVTDGVTRVRLPEYAPWQSMLTRCLNPNAADYPAYGGRGILVCHRWRKFAHFRADMGPRPSPAHSLDRYPNQDGNYEPGNVRWATPQEQARNRSTNRLITYQGQVKCLSEWAEILGITSAALSDRLDHHSPDRALQPDFQRVAPSGIKPKRPTSSRFVGVSRRANNRWTAQIKRCGVKLHLGLFASEEAAAAAYDRKAVELFGRTARLNFPVGVPA